MAPSRGVKATVEYTCRLLASLGVAGATPEALRQAKFSEGGQSTCARLWRALYVLVVLQLAGYPGDSTRAKCLKELCESLDSEERTQEACAFVQHYLAVWGYPASSPVFSLATEGVPSRELLLALAWLMSHCKVFQKGLQRRVRKALAAVPAHTTLPRPCYPEDALSSQEAASAAESAWQEAQEYVKLVIAAVDEMEGPRQTHLQGKQVLMLYGRLRGALSALASAQAYHIKLLHSLNTVQQEVHKALTKCAEENGFGPLPRLPTYSLYELQLLKDPQQLQAHKVALEVFEALLQDIRAHKDHEELFWQWMESVIDEHEKEDVNSQASTPEQEAQSDDLLHVSQQLDCQVAAAPESCLEAAEAFLKTEGWPGYGALREEVLGALKDSGVTSREESLPDDIVELLAQAALLQEEDRLRNGNLVKPFQAKPLAQQRHILQAEEGEVKAKSSAQKDVERLMESALMSARVLSRTRAHNRQALQESVNLLKEDPNIMFVGI